VRICICIILRIQDTEYFKRQELIMAGGWTRDGGVQDQIDASVEDAVKLARSRLAEGEGSTHCEECETVIPEARRKAIPGVRLYVSCQSEREKRQAAPTGFNRRGSKDSQLK
jgi:phage/conjugal plasmid C-4 type zinc finger TraR family protein